jgi:hypothetical protein
LHGHIIEINEYLDIFAVQKEAEIVRSKMRRQIVALMEGEKKMPKKCMRQPRLHASLRRAA